MADLKISQMTDGGLVETTDEIPVNRGGQNYKVKVGEASTYNVGSGDSDLPTGLDVTNKINSQGFIAFEQDSVGDNFYPQADGSEILNVKIPVSATDQLSEYLEDKLSAGTNISITKMQDSSGVEYLEISSSGSGAAQASDVEFDNSGTDLDSDNLQDALVEIDTDFVKLDRAQVWTKGQSGGLVILTAGATVTPDLSLGNYFRITPDQNFTLANPINIPNDAKVPFTIEVIQPVGGPYLMTLDTLYRTSGGSAIALTATAQRRDVLYGEAISTRVDINIIPDMRTP